MSPNPDVLLITRDTRLQGVLAASRPSGMRLSTHGALDLHAPVATGARQTWIDLDTAEVKGVPVQQHRLVYFTMPGTAPPTEWPTAPCIAKPVRTMTAEILWAGVAAQPAGSSISTSAIALPERPEGAAWLPAWTTELLVENFADARTLAVDLVATRLGFRCGLLYLRGPQGSDLVLAESCGPEPGASVQMDSDALRLLVQVQSLRCILTRSSDHWRAWSAGDDMLQQPPALMLPLLAGAELAGALLLTAPLGERAVLRVDELYAIGRLLGRSLTISRKLEESRREARVDELTGLYNYRWMRETLRAELRRAERHRTPLALLALDVDSLKAINDRWGHAAGDAALRAVAARVSSTLRQFDFAARVGGDEFLVLLPATDLEGARKVAERIQERLASANLRSNQQPIALGASIGIAQSARGDTVDQITRAADLAMYRAKGAGGGRTVLADCEGEPSLGQNQHSSLGEKTAPTLIGT